MNADWKHKNEINRWLASEFRFGSVANIRINLRPFYDGRTNTFYANNTVDDAKRIACRFRTEANQRFFGKKARRYGKDAGLRMISAVHYEPHLHLHILCEIPTRTVMNSNGPFSFQQERFDDLTDFVKNFCQKHRMISGDLYIEEANSVIASLNYNSRNGTDTVIDF